MVAHKLAPFTCTALRTCSYRMTLGSTLTNVVADPGTIPQALLRRTPCPSYNLSPLMTVPADRGELREERPRDDEGSPGPSSERRVSHPPSSDRGERGSPAKATSEDGFVIEPRRGWVALDLREVWRYRELLFFIAWRDVKVRYQQTFFGIAWAIIQPLFMMIVFSFVFGRFAKLPSDGMPYPLFTLCALIPWQLFQYSLTQSSNSLVNSQAIIKKVYFPRLVVPIAAVLDGLVDFGIALLLFLGLMLGYGYAPGFHIIFLPVFVLMATLAALSVGIWLCALNVKYRDVRYTIPFLTQLWMFATPVAYSASIVPEKWRWAYGLNPMVGVIEGFRWALVGREAPLAGSTYTSVGAVALVLLGGLAYFRRMEATFADIV
jgi:lipopolysaccharide transport system permease protein